MFVPYHNLKHQAQERNERKGINPFNLHQIPNPPNLVWKSQKNYLPQYPVCHQSQHHQLNTAIPATDAISTISNSSSITTNSIQPTQNNINTEQDHKPKENQQLYRIQTATQNQKVLPVPMRIHHKSPPQAQQQPMIESPITNQSGMNNIFHPTQSLNVLQASPTDSNFLNIMPTQVPISPITTNSNQQDLMEDIQILSNGNNITQNRESNAPEPPTSSGQATINPFSMDLSHHAPYIHHNQIASYQLNASSNNQPQPPPKPPAPSELMPIIGDLAWTK